MGLISPPKSSAIVVVVFVVSAANTHTPTKMTDRSNARKPGRSGGPENSSLSQQFMSNPANVAAEKCEERKLHVKDTTHAIAYSVTIMGQ